MFYVSSKNNDNWGVTDTEDGIEDFFTKPQLLKIARKVEIDGVDTFSSSICIVKSIDETVRLFKQGKVHLALSTMSIENKTVAIKFKSKPTKGEMKFVSHKCIRVARSSVNEYNFDLDSSKSYRSGLTLDDVLMIFENNFNGWQIEDVRKI